MAFEITDSNFETEVLNSEQVSLVEFWAAWCGPCRTIAPIIEELAKEYDGKALIGKVNADENPELIGQYHIRNIPTIIYLKKGQIVHKQVGAVPKSILEDELKKHL